MSGKVTFVMEYYEMALQGLYRFFTEYGDKKYSLIIKECIDRWQKNKDAAFFSEKVSKNGEMAEFSLKCSERISDERSYTAFQLFGALVSMAAQLAVFINQKFRVDIDFIRRNFGRPTEVINGTFCRGCGADSISSADIAEYILPTVIAERIVDGLENNTLEKNIVSVMELTAPEIELRRNSVKQRIENSKILFSEVRWHDGLCPVCGSGDTKTRRFLKSLNKNIFIPLKI